MEKRLGIDMGTNSLGWALVEMTEEGCVLLDRGVDIFQEGVAHGKSGEHLVFMIPVACELDLRKAARAAGEKSVAMVRSRELFELTGYVHGGCSPLGMKKPFRTFIDETCILFDTILFSGGRIGTQIEMSFDDLANIIEIEAVDLVV